MKKKSISPIIATILLIIMTVGIATLMYTWMSGMFTRLTGQAEQQIVTVGAVDFELIHITHSGNNFDVTLLNKGSVSLNLSRPGVFVSVEFFQKPYGSRQTSPCTIQNSGELTDIKPGEIKRMTINCTNVGTINLDLFRYIITVNYLGVARSITYG